MQSLEPRGGLDAKLVDERIPQALEFLERPANMTGPVQRGYQLGEEALVHRMACNQGRQFADQVRVPTESKIGVNAPAESGQVRLLQRHRLKLQHAPRPDVHESRPAPQGKGTAEQLSRQAVIAAFCGRPPRPGKPRELLHVDLAAIRR